MPPEILLLYVTGYVLWFGYAINRFDVVSSNDPYYYILHSVIALFWPIAIALYVPYRMFSFFGVGGYGSNRRR